jgi:uncharacterized protein
MINRLFMKELMHVQAHPHKKTHRTGCLGKFLALLPVTCILLYPFYEAAHITVIARNVRSAKLPAAFNGLKIVYLSDIHYGALFSARRVRDLVTQVNALQPDVILLGGDYGENSQGALDFFALAPAFRADCVVGTVGNHDRTLGNHIRIVPDSNLDAIMRAMRLNGIEPLVNGSIVLSRGNSTLAICGVDDFYNGLPDIQKAAEGAARADYTIFMPHTPDILPDAYFAMGDQPWFDLALCGHTHGGQIAVFGHSILTSSIYRDRFRSGWYNENGVDILVTNGVGTSFLPVRIGAPPQIHVLTLLCGDPV